MTLRNNSLDFAYKIRHFKKMDKVMETVSKDKLCPCCKQNRKMVERRRTQNAYVNDDLNFITSCPACFEADDAYWKERWDEYYGRRF